MLKQISAVVAGACLAVGVFAADGLLRSDHPDTYIVQKGDTLWDISGKFLSKPWLWPEIWQANPQVENPHLIFPGDQLNLVWIDGKPRLVRGDGGDRPPFGPRVRAEPLSDATTAIPLSSVLPFLEKMRIVDKADYEAMPYVVAIEENRLRGTPGQAIYVRGLDVAPGTRVLVVRATNEYREVPDSFPWEEARRRVDARSLEMDEVFTRPSWYWTWTLNWTFRRQTEYLGTEVLEIAQGEVLRGGDPASVLVQVADNEIRAGDRIIVGGSMPFDLTFYPRAPKAAPDNVRVVALSGTFNAAGPDQVIALSRGARDGIGNGEVFAIYHPGEEIVDRVKYPNGSLSRTFQPGRTRVTTPEEFVGHAMVFRTFDRISYALIMDGIRPVQPGDVLHAPGR
jgi:nucleoid-associated protein YgaU